MHPPSSPDRGGNGRSIVAVLGLAVTIALCLAGLVAVGFFVVLMIGMSQWQTNK
jgi:hypothetical protein